MAASEQNDGGSVFDSMTTGERLRHLRFRRRLALREVADAIGISLASLSRYEKDEIDPPGEVVRRLALFYGVSSDYILRLKATAR